MIIFYLCLFVVTGIALLFWLKADIDLKKYLNFQQTNAGEKKQQNGKLTIDTVIADELYSSRNYYENTKVVKTK